MAKLSWHWGSVNRRPLLTPLGVSSSTGPGLSGPASMIDWILPRRSQIAESTPQGSVVVAGAVDKLITHRMHERIKIARR